MPGFRQPGPQGVTLDADKPIDPGTSARTAMPPAAPSPPPAPVPPPVDADTLQLAAVAYGESSSADVADEMLAIAKVMVRQAGLRGWKGVAAFIAGDKTFAYAGHDGNPRHAALLRATPAARRRNPGMKAALEAAEAALSGAGADPSNGAYFWDGSDLKANYAAHPKVVQGIRFTDPSHDIYKLGSNEVPGEEFWRDANGKKTKSRGKWKHVWDSAAAQGGTVFWKYNDDYLKATGGKEFR